MHTPVVHFEHVEASESIREFVQYLREHGFIIGYAELKAMVQMPILAGVDDWRAISKYWRAIASSSRKQWLKFPDLFEAYWFPHKVKGGTKTVGIERQGKSLPQLIQEIKGESSGAPNKSSRSIGLSSNTDQGEGIASNQSQGGASRVDPLSEKPLGEWLPQDSAQLDNFISPLRSILRHKLIRRFRKSTAASKIDLPKSIRRACATGGELIHLHMKERATIPPRIFILVDVSKSMESHAQFFLRMARSFSQVLEARVFVFHTTLAEVTYLMKRDSGRVQEKINAVTFGFGGGTKIGTNLEKFLLVAQKKSIDSSGGGIGRRDVVYILSDGYDTDPPEKMRDAIRAIKQLGVDLYWLHPTLEIPKSKAILMSQGDISDFMPVSHLSSLSNLVKLSRAGAHKKKLNFLNKEM